MARRRGAYRPRAGIPKWIWWIVTALPAIFMLIGLGTLADAVIYATDAKSTRGEVVHVSRIYGAESGLTYRPTIRYRRDDGRTFEAETHISSGGYDYHIGARVDILYSYDEPTEVRIDSLFSLYGPGLIFAVVGALFLGIIIWVRGKAGSGAVLGLVASALAERRQGAAGKQGSVGEPDRSPEPETTDPSKPGHVHKPKPKRTPVVRRMR